MVRSRTVPARCARRSRLLVAWAALSLLAGACAAGGTEGAGETPPDRSPEEPGPSTDPATSPAVPSPAPAETVSPVAQESIPVDDRMLLSVDHPGGPDWITILAGTVWVKKDNGDLVGLDPATGEVTSTVSVGRCSGIGAADGSVWTCSGPDVVRVEPGQAEPSAVIPAGKMGDQGHMPALDGRVWVLTGDGSQMRGIDTTTNEVGTPIALNTRCTDLATDGQALYAVCPVDGFVLRVDPDDGVQVRTPLAKARTVSAADGSVWVGFEDGLARMQADDLSTVTVYAGLNPGLGGALAAYDGSLWVRRPGASMLVRVDAGSGEVGEEIVWDGELSGGDLVVDADGIWTTAYDDALILHLSSA